MFRYLGWWTRKKRVRLRRHQIRRSILRNVVLLTPSEMYVLPYCCITIQLKCHSVWLYWRSDVSSFHLGKYVFDMLDYQWLRESLNPWSLLTRQSKDDQCSCLSMLLSKSRSLLIDLIAMLCRSHSCLSL